MTRGRALEAFGGPAAGSSRERPALLILVWFHRRTEHAPELAGTNQVAGGTRVKKLFADKAKERREAAQQQEEKPKRYRQTRKGAKRTPEVPLEEAAAEAPD